MWVNSVSLSLAVPAFAFGAELVAAELRSIQITGFKSLIGFIKKGESFLRRQSLSCFSDLNKKKRLYNNDQKGFYKFLYFYWGFNFDGYLSFQLQYFLFFIFSFH